MERNFARSLDRVLRHEGGFVNHPKDPGGATNKGITIATFRRFIKADGTVAELKAITDQQVATVYRRQYWDVVKGDQLPAGVDYVVFDGAVNSGTGQSGKWLQRALGGHYKGKVDGQIGQSTLAAVAAHPNHDALVSAICDRRMAFLQALKTWRTFGKGWKRRVDEVRAEAAKMAATKPAVPEPAVTAPAPAAVSPPTPEATAKPAAGIAALVIAGILTAGAWVAGLPCDLFGVLCK
jgi:lysozyme family protein